MNITQTQAKIFFLEMQHQPASISMLQTNFSATELTKPLSAALYRDLYFGVGEKWNWLDRMVISDAELEEKINQPHVHIFVFEVEGKQAGYVELVEEDDLVEILYFGLFPTFTGKGLGPSLLQWVINKAWSYNKPLVQLNTCSLDHPKALEVYLKAGFELVRTETQERKILVKE